MNKKLKTLVIGSAVFSLAVGSVAMPAAYAASNTANTVVNAVIGSVISISSAGPVNLNITPTASGSATSASDTVTVSTNNEPGYTLQIADSDATTTLTKGSDTIAATSGTFAAPAAMSANSWGFRIDAAPFTGTGTTAETNVASFTNNNWAAVPDSGSPATIKTTSSTAINDTTTVWYGAFVNSSKPNGTYTDTVTYTAATR